MAQQVKLSKSRLIAFLQCPKRLWLEIHKPELKEESAQDRARFQTGYDVGDKARDLYPGGHLIAPDNDLQKALSDTDALIKVGASEPLYEATFRHDDLLVRADILLKQGAKFDLIEVKSSTKLKDYQINDAAIQAWVVEGAGAQIAETTVAHVDSKWVYPGDEKYAGLLKLVPVSGTIGPRMQQIPGWLTAARETVEGPEPEITMGKQCSDPFPCGFAAYCTKLAGLDTEYPVTLLPKRDGKTLARKLYAQGHRDLRNVPDELIVKPGLKVIHQACKSGKASMKPGARAVISGWSYPRYYLDFETIQFAVPIWPGTRPYQQIPFQWSCHIEKAQGAFEHASFLEVSGNNPARALAESLITLLGKQGAIIAYNASFERSVVKDLAAAFPDLATPLLAIHDRIEDLLPVTRDHYYHPAMKGSWSIKAVVEAMAPELTYKNLGEVQGGTAAQVAYAEAIAPATTAERKAKIKKDLEIYCERDTLAMVRVAQALS